VPTHFGNSVGESTTSCMSSMKKGSSSVNRSDLDKNNILKPTFDTLMKEDRKALEAYLADLEEPFYSHDEVMRQELVLKDVAPIMIRKAEVTPEVRPDPSLSLNDVQSMINSALERKAKSSDELMRRLIEERDGKNLLILMSILLLLLALLILLKPIPKQVAHQRATLQYQTHQPSR
jgi:hypothetical protein